jgi:hypothetical protein
MSGNIDTESDGAGQRRSASIAAQQITTDCANLSDSGAIFDREAKPHHRHDGRPVRADRTTLFDQNLISRY